MTLESFENLREEFLEHVSRYGWVAVRFAAGYVEGFWR